MACSKFITTDTAGGTSGTGTGTGTGTGGNNAAPTPGQTPPDTSKGSAAPTPLPPDTTHNGGGTGSGGTTISNVDINISFTSPCAPSSEVFTFKSLVTGVPSGASYEWYFGDGKSSIGTASTVTHSYQYGGNVSVEMKITSGGKTLADISKAIQPVGQNITPVANFYSQANDPTGAPNVITFNSQSQATQGFITNLQWNFGDGTTSSQSQPTHSYTQTTVDQTFTVTLTATGSVAGCTNTISHSVFIPAKYVVGGSFNYTSTNPCAPSHEVFTFVSNNTGVPANAIYKWDFSDGSPDVYGQTVNHTFTYKNTYNVTLTITFNGLVIYTEQQAVKTFGQDTNPQAGFYAQYTNPTTYSFNSTNSIGGGYSITNYAWDFGDGTTSNLPSVVNHVFPKSAVDKTYTIIFQVTANSGCSAQATNTQFIPAN
jgi:PKD repeat protein